MTRKLIPMAIAYDFDGTLASGNIQENSFIPAIGMNKATFWKKNKARAEKHEADEVLSYMTYMLERAAAEDVPVRKGDFAKHGKTVRLFRGVSEWFDHIDAYAKERHVKLQHFIISSGIKEMIEATKIGKKFTKVFASSFAYDANGAAKWPALAINYTTKTQYLFRINKGSLNVSVANGMLDLKWGRMRFPDSRFTLVTSDRPLDMPSLGMKDSYIALPIGPRSIFLATPAPLKQQRLSPAQQTDIVRSFNEGTVRRARQYVWSIDDSARDFVRKYVCTLPDRQLLSRSGLELAKKQARGEE